MRNILILFLSTLLLFGQKQSIKIKSKYHHLKLINEWIFLSMETLTKNESKSKEIIYADENNVETLSFHRSGSISYNSFSKGESIKGRGKWMVNRYDGLRIIAESDTIDTNYIIEKDTLTIFTVEENGIDTKENKNVIRYKKKIS